MNNFTISIITVCFNDEIALKRTVESVKRQRYKLQHVVVDGGSTDGTVKYLENSRFEHPNLTYISEADKGVYDAINKGIRIATEDYILVLNAGDTFTSDSVLDDIVSSGVFFNQNYFICRVNYIYSSGKTKCDNKEFPSKYYLECSHQAFIYKKNIHDKLGYYSLEYKSASDYDFFANVFLEYGLTQKEKYPYFIANREKFGGDMSDSVKHTLEMIRIDYKNSLLKHTIFRRLKEVMIKSLRLLVKLVN